MLRLGAIFIVLCMVLISASVGAALYLLAGLHAAESMMVSVAVLTGLAIYNTVTGRLRDRPDVGTQIADLARGTGDLARQVGELRSRLSSVEGQGDKIIDGTAEKVRVSTEGIATELAEVGTLVKQLAETVALHEIRFAGARDFAPGAALARPAATETMAPNGPSEPRKAVKDETIAAIREAVEAGRVDLYLQPIVTLPQRKVRYYEAFTRLRTADGGTLAPPDFMDAAEAGGLMPQIDKLLLFRSVQVVRRLQLKNREIGLFCNIAASTLNHAQIFGDILQFMDANRALAPALILELRQDTFRAMGPMETESIAALRELGFRFCMDGVTDLRIEPRDLGERGIRYVKVAASVLLGEAASAGSDIHAADLSDLLARFGVTLIAEKIEGETQVIDLLEYDVRFGQGFLFSQPRPVRAEALRGAAEAADQPDMEDQPARKVAGGSGSAF